MKDNGSLYPSLYSVATSELVKEKSGNFLKFIVYIWKIDNFVILDLMEEHAKAKLATFCLEIRLEKYGKDLKKSEFHCYEEVTTLNTLVRFLCSVQLY